MLMSPVVHADVNIDFDLVDFFHVWRNEQNAISQAHDIRLSPFKLRWVRINEEYTHIRFEAILRTLIFMPF
jgi:hypothetical protein